MSFTWFLHVGLPGLLAAVLIAGSGPVHADEVDELKAQLRKAQEDVTTLKAELAKLKEVNRESQRKEALEWAEGVASDFLSALNHKDYDAAASLMSLEFKQHLAPGKAELKDQRYDREKLLEKLKGVSTTLKKGQEMGKLSPDLSEATFRAVTNGSRLYRLRIGSEGKDKGRWRVQFFSEE